MKKKGISQSITILMDTLIAIAVIFSFWFMAHSMGTKDFFVREKIARDGALMVDSLVGLEGNAWMTYPSSTSHYDVSLTATDVRVAFERRPFTHHFPGALTVRPGQLTKADALFFKEGSVVSLSDKKPQMKKLDCPGTPFPHFSSVKMKVMPEYMPVPTALGLGCRPADGHLTCGRGERSEVDLFVKVVPLERAGVTARFRYDAKPESKEFACQLLNALVEKHDVWLLPTDDEDLKQGPIAVLIEGNDISAIGNALVGVVQR